MWFYGILLRKKTLTKYNHFQSIILRMITDAPFYVTNLTLHSDLNIQTVTEVVKSS